MKLKNKQGEKIDFIVEGKSNSPMTVIFVHGFGTNRDEGYNLFADISKPLAKKYRLLRFDFSGYGKSEGKQENVNLIKQASDLEAVLKYTKGRYGNRIWIIACSNGCHVVSMLSPDGIEKTVFVSPPDSRSSQVIKRLKYRIESRPGGILSLSGISKYPRTGGEIQFIGSDYWKMLKKFKLSVLLKKYAKKTRMAILVPKDDDFIEHKNMRLYKTIKSAYFSEIDGNHAFTKGEDRKRLIVKIQSFLETP